MLTRGLSSKKFFKSIHDWLSGPEKLFRGEISCVNSVGCPSTELDTTNHVAIQSEPSMSKIEPILSISETIPSITENKPILSQTENVPILPKPIKSSNEPILSITKPILSMNENLTILSSPILSKNEPIMSKNENSQILSKNCAQIVPNMSKNVIDSNVFKLGENICKPNISKTQEESKIQTCLNSVENEKPNFQ